MSRKMLGIHSCWLDSWCRKFGVPPFLYFHLWWFTIRLNPIYTPKKAQWRDISPWEFRPWHWVQIWRNHESSKTSRADGADPEPGSGS